MSKHGDINCCPTVETKADGTNWLEKTHESYNNYYKTYYAAWCRKSGLPMLNSSCWERIQDEKLYTVSRAKKEHVCIDKSKVCGWFRLWHGYVPLFKDDIEE